MEHYVVNKNAHIKTGEHKIHTEKCKRKPKRANTKELGEFDDAIRARYEATKYYLIVNGCKFCCKDIYLKG